MSHKPELEIEIGTPGGTSRRYQLVGSFLVIGRDSCCHIRVDDPRMALQHAMIICDGDGVPWLQDLGSKDGCRVNGNRCSSCALSVGDVIQVLDHRLQLRSVQSNDADAIYPVVFADQLTEPSPEGADKLTAVSLDSNHFEQASSDKRRLSWLQRIAVALCTATDEEALQAAILDAVLGSVACQRCVLALLNADTGRIEPVVWRQRDHGDWDAESCVALSATVLALVVKGQTVLVDDVEMQSNLREAESLRKQAVRSVLCVPIRIDGKTIGVVYADDAQHPNAFNANDASYLTTLAQFAGIGLRNVDSMARSEKMATELRSEIGDLYQPIFVSPLMQQLYDRLPRIADSDAHVLISGETGVGKEVLARSVHALSKRSTRAFVVMNCASTPADLMESQLFGHVRGAFTGAVRDRTGKFKQADGGTLFLDEIGDMPLVAQAKLLRAVQFGELERLGDDRITQFSIRVIAATNRDLRSEVTAGRFREDLLYRLSVVPLVIPPLKERPEDIPVLTGFFLHQLRRRHGTRILKLSSTAMRVLSKHTWPGNIRELENAIEHATIVANTQTIRPTDLPDSVRKSDGLLSKEIRTLEETEKEYIQHVLDLTSWNVKRTAELLEIPRRTLHERLNKFGLQRPS